MSSLSIAIHTKERPALLSKCLISLVAQLHQNDQLIVIDNSDSSTTRKIVSTFNEHIKNKVEYHNSSKNNLASLRNIALSKSKYRWLVFIDDDCVPQLDLLKEFRKVVSNSKKKSVAIQGLSYPLEKSVVSLSLFFLEYLGVQNHVEQRPNSPQILDTKNVALDTLFLKNNNICFDEFNFPTNSEDTDLGFQISKSGGEFAILNSAKVGHHYDKDFLEYYSYLWNRTKGELILEKKWELSKKNESKLRILSLYISSLNRMKREFDFSFQLYFFVASNLLSSYFFIKMTRFLVRKI